MSGASGSGGTTDGEHWIVVGAGSAGCVLADRLTEQGRRRVTLVEAGPDLAPGDVPASIVGADFFAALDEPERVFADLWARRTSESAPAFYARGRGVGGSSVVNAMIALRGDPAMYRGWGWHDAGAAWERIRLPEEPVPDHQLGRVDRALLAADPAAVIARLTRRDGRRVTSAEASLWPATSRPELRLSVGRTVRRVVLDGRRAVGVELGDGEVLLGDRVVLAAGAIHSPAILLRSGVDIPGVGRGLQDHPAVAFTLRLHADAVADPGSLAVGSLARHGPVQFLPMNHLGRLAEGLGLLMVAHMRPRGRSGTVSLGPDPDGQPTVDFDLLSDERDLVELVDGVRSARRLLDHPAFREIVAEVHIDGFGTPIDRLTDDATIASWIRSHCADYVHASSSCAMGRVVDADGWVLDHHGLAVADASVFPTIPDANTHLPVTMCAERLAMRWNSRD